MIYTKQYATEAEYNAATDIVLPNVSLIGEGDSAEVKYNPYEIDPKYAPCGTIVLAKTDTTNTASTVEDKIFVPYEKYSASAYSDYTPIGVVLMPYTHTPDETVRIMSLKNMSMKTPESGSVVQNGNTADTSMYWGYNGAEVQGLSNYNKVPIVDPSNQESGTISATDWARVPSDYTASTNFNGTASTLDVGSKYYTSNESGRFAISPWTTYGWKSYKALSVNDKSTNALLDYDGKGNTDILVSVHTATTITNTNAVGNYPAAKCCSLYHTIGLGQGEWYLPACGELVYLPCRYAEIGAALTTLMTQHPTEAVRLWRYDTEVKDSSSSLFGSWLWSSSQCSSDIARSVNIHSGYVSNLSKSYTHEHYRVRAVASLNLS